MLMRRNLQSAETVRERGGTTALLALRGFFPACSLQSCVVAFVYFYANPPSYVNWKNVLCLYWILFRQFLCSTRKGKACRY
jgi:hypothetical protein